MPRPVARFQIMSGLPGCLPDSADAYELTTRREVVEAFRDYLKMLDLPASLVRQIRWTRLWSQIKERGASSIHVCVQHKSTVVEIAGMTEGEYQEWADRNDC